MGQRVGPMMGEPCGCLEDSAVACRLQEMLTQPPRTPPVQKILRFNVPTCSAAVELDGLAGGLGRRGARRGRTFRLPATEDRFCSVAEQNVSFRSIPLVTVCSWTMGCVCREERHLHRRQPQFWNQGYVHGVDPHRGARTRKCHRVQGCERQQPDFRESGKSDTLSFKGVFFFEPWMTHSLSCVSSRAVGGGLTGSFTRT